MNRDLIIRFIEIQAVLLAPITPHVSEYIWTKLLKKGGSVRVAHWPNRGNIDEMVLKQNSYLRNTIHTMRLKRDVYMKPRKPKKGEKQEGVGRFSSIFYLHSFIYSFCFHPMSFRSNFYSPPYVLLPPILASRSSHESCSIRCQILPRLDGQNAEPD